MNTTFTSAYEFGLRAFSPRAAIANGYAVPQLEAVAFNHALVALAAKLAAVDGLVNKAEYAAFHSLFDEGDASHVAKNRSLFVQRIADASTALQYARQIAAMTHDETALHRDLLSRLVRIATSDAAMNAAELELLRAVSDCFGLPREIFRETIAQGMVRSCTSPYDVLGVSAQVDDAALREHYMAQVQKLHPDRYQAAGASAETIAMLSDQLAGVNAAYKKIQTLRAAKPQRAEGANGWWSRLNTKSARVN